MKELRLLFDKAANGNSSIRLDNYRGSNASEPRLFEPSLTDATVRIELPELGHFSHAAAAARRRGPVQPR